MTDDLVEKVAVALWADEFEGYGKFWDEEHDTDKESYRGHARAALSAIEDAGWVVVPVRENANFITGRAPLDLCTAIDLDSVGEGALYVDGLTLDEAGALIKKVVFARPRITGETT